MYSYINIVNSIAFDNDQKLVVGGTDTSGGDSFRFARMFVSENLSIDEFSEDNSFLIYPNPVKDQITFKSDKNIAFVSVNDVNGRLLELEKPTKLNSEYKLDVSHLRYGIYILNINYENSKQTLKFIKK